MLIHIGCGPAPAVFVGLDKAYERVNSLVVFPLLTRAGVCGRILKWLSDYLSKYTSQVQLQGELSKEVTVEGGTPQGSILSPFLFSVIVNELAHATLLDSVKMFCYADDLAIVAVGPQREAHIL